MIQLRSVLTAADNSGAKQLRVIQVYGGSFRKFGYVGDVVMASVIKSDTQGTIKKGDKVRAVIVRTKKEKRRNNGEYIRFDDNAVAIIDAKNEPKGSRIFGPVARELRDRNFLKIVSLAPEVL